MIRVRYTVKGDSQVHERECLSVRTETYVGGIEGTFLVFVDFEGGRTVTGSRIEYNKIDRFEIDAVPTYDRIAGKKSGYDEPKTRAEEGREKQDERIFERNAEISRRLSRLRK